MSMNNIIKLILRLLVSIIFLETLYFKFTAHPDSLLIFYQLGIEPWGRIGLGVIELIIAILILHPKTNLIGMVGSLVVILGALFSHILILGVNFNNDGGRLFTLSVIVLIASITFLLMHKKDLISLLLKVIKK